VWSLPCDACCDAVYLPAGVISVYVEICRHVINFTQSCWNSDCELVKYIVNLGINVSRMRSPIGRNACDEICPLALLQIYIFAKRSNV